MDSRLLEVIILNSRRAKVQIKLSSLAPIHE
jgi:hypothetical protein